MERWQLPFWLPLVYFTINANTIMANYIITIFLLLLLVNFIMIIIDIVTTIATPTFIHVSGSRNMISKEGRGGWNRWASPVGKYFTYTIQTHHHNIIFHFFTFIFIIITTAFTIAIATTSITNGINACSAVITTNFIFMWWKERVNGLIMYYNRSVYLCICQMTCVRFCLTTIITIMIWHHIMLIIRCSIVCTSINSMTVVIFNTGSNVANNTIKSNNTVTYLCIVMDYCVTSNEHIT